VRVRYDRDALPRPHHQCTGGIGAPREDQGHSGLVDAQERDKIEELLWVVQLLQAVRLLAANSHFYPILISCPHQCFATLDFHRNL
jgi:hypothetical protein